MSSKARIGVVGALLAACAPMMMGQGCIPGAGTGTGGGGGTAVTSLEGTWNGNITIGTKYATSITGPTTATGPGSTSVTDSVSLSMTFNAAGTPSVLPVIGLYDPTTGHITAANVSLVQQGQVNTFNIGSVFYTVTVQQATYTPTFMRAVLSVQAAGGTSLPGPGGYTESMTAGPATQVLDATLNSSTGTVTWTQPFAVSSISTRTYVGSTMIIWAAQDTTGSATLAK
jgi:hypothetical protein